jgi:hypothetical protein
MIVAVEELRGHVLMHAVERVAHAMEEALQKNIRPFKKQAVKLITRQRRPDLLHGRSTFQVFPHARDWVHRPHDRLTFLITAENV